MRHIDHLIEKYIRNTYLYFYHYTINLQKYLKYLKPSTFKSIITCYLPITYVRNIFFAIIALYLPLAYNFCTVNFYFCSSNNFVVIAVIP